MVKILFSVCALLFSSFSVSETVANISNNNTLVTNRGLLKTMTQKELQSKLFQEQFKNLSGQQLEKVYVGQAKTGGQVVGKFGKPVGNLAYRAVSTVPLRTVAAAGVSRATGWGGIVISIGGPLIQAGFKKLEDDNDPDRWWKPNLDEKGKIYYTTPPRSCSASINQCVLKQEFCIMSNSPSGSCPSGYAGASPVGNGFICMDDKGHGVGLKVCEGRFPWMPVSDAEKVDAIVNFHTYLEPNEDGFYSDVLKTGINFDSNIEIELEPSQTITSAPYTNPNTGQAQQTQINVDSKGKPWVRYLPRPDLTPNSEDAPTAQPNDKTEEEIKEDQNTQNQNNQNNQNKDCTNCQILEKLGEIDDKLNPDNLIVPPVPPLNFPESNIDVDLKPDKFLNDSNVCPAPRQMALSIGTGQVSYQPLCDLSSGLKPIFLLCCGFIASWIFVRGLNG